MFAAALVVAPWYARNRVVVGPGAGLSTVGGLNFYYAHNDHQYGWHPLQVTPLEGLSDVAMQARGYALGFEFLSHARLTRIVRDIQEGTVRLYSPLAYTFALYWNTLCPERSGGAPPETRLLENVVSVARDGIVKGNA